MYDFIVYGATGFTGRQAAAYLAAACERSGLRLAVAGRSPERLTALAAGLPGPVGCIVADSGRPDTVDAMVRQGRVMVSTAGPFTLYGTPVLGACVRHGVDYVDITGETPWVCDMIARHHDEAAARGVRIIPMCGFDSVPSDISAFLFAHHVRTVLRERCADVHGFFSMSGGLNGGTLASLLTLLESGERARLHDRFLLNPPGTRPPAGHPVPADLTPVAWRPALGRWTAPFAMAPINTRVVRRSSALLQRLEGASYGEGFSYAESMLVGSRVEALGFRVGLAVFEQLSRLRLFRRILRRLGPGPGQGPSEAAMDNGYTKVQLIGATTSGRRLRVRFEGPGDPGNRVTVRMLCEAALALRLQRAELPGGAARGGILTPATGLGMVLVERLRAAGMTLSVEPLDDEGEEGDG